MKGALFCLGGAIVLCGVLSAMNSSSTDAKPVLTPEAARLETVNNEPDPVLTPAEIVAHCGSPARITKKESGKGKDRTIYTLLWYPHARTQIMLGTFPEEKPEHRGPSWINAFPLSKTGKENPDDLPYDPDEVASHLPCAAAWARDGQSRLYQYLAAYRAAHPSPTN